MMACIVGRQRPRTLVARLAFFLSRRSYGRVIASARVYALDSGLLLAVGLMEEVQERAISGLSRFVTGWWERVHRLSPKLVGGCRPLELRSFLPLTHWQVGYHHVVTAFGVPSEIIIASPQ